MAEGDGREGDREAGVGRAEPRSPSDLDALARVAPADVEEGRDVWREHAPRRHRDLYDARRAKDEDGD